MSLLLTASGVFPGRRWYHGWICDSEGAALLVQEGQAWICVLLCANVFPYLCKSHVLVFKDGIGLDAINDSFLLEASIYRLLRRHCRDQPYYVHLLELFAEVLCLWSVRIEYTVTHTHNDRIVLMRLCVLQTSFQTELGQALDLMTAPPDQIDLNRFSMQRLWCCIQSKFGETILYQSI